MSTVAYANLPFLSVLAIDEERLYLVILLCRMVYVCTNMLVIVVRLTEDNAKTITG